LIVKAAAGNVRPIDEEQARDLLRSAVSGQRPS